MNAGLKRSPLKRTSMAPKPRKPILCDPCKQPFRPERMGQKSCSVPCAIRRGKRLAREKAQREREKAAKVERRERKAAKEKLRTRREWLAIAQREFNKFVRLRDAGRPCICCGRASTDDGLLTGSRWDAGHYRSVGAAPHLRFHEDNCHRQLVFCNRDRSGNAVDYRIGLIARIGLDRVEALETDNNIKRWTIEELKQIASEYRRKARELERSR